MRIKPQLCQCSHKAIDVYGTPVQLITYALEKNHANDTNMKRASVKTKFNLSHKNAYPLSVSRNVFIIVLLCVITLLSYNR